MAGRMDGQKDEKDGRMDGRKNEQKDGRTNDESTQ